MDKILFRGIMPALLTPFDENEKLKADTVRELLDYGYDRGVHGFYVGGATGEGPALSVRTRMELCETVMEANRGRGRIILHVGGPNFGDVKTLIEHADRMGVDAISSMAPNAYYAHTDRELTEYYKKIALLTDKPVLIYATNLMSGNALIQVLTDLMRVPNIIGLKFTLPNYYLLSLLKMIDGGNINVINGPDETLISGLAMGADGGIGSTYNLMPERYVRLYNAFTRGDLAGARREQYEINRVIRVLIEYGGGTPVIKNLKAAMGRLGFDMGYPAFPSERLSEDETDRLMDQLKEAGFRP